MPTFTDADKKSPLWKDVVKTLIGASPIVPSPAESYVTSDTPLGDTQRNKGLSLSDDMQVALQVNWNEMRHVFGFGSSPFITNRECANFSTAGDIYFRISWAV